MDMDDRRPRTVRELIGELSEVEDALRLSRQPATGIRPAAVAGSDPAELVHREQLIVHELRRRARSHQLGWPQG